MKVILVRVNLLIKHQVIRKAHIIRASLSWTKGTLEVVMAIVPLRETIVLMVLLHGSEEGFITNVLSLILFFLLLVILIAAVTTSTSRVIIAFVLFAPEHGSILLSATSRP